MKIKLLLKFKYEIKIKGVIFCHVNIKKQDNQFNPSIIEGNHKWKGIILIFIKRGIIIKILLLIINIIDLLIKKIIKIIEVKAWIKKYFIVDSIEYIDDFKFKIGIIENKFNSNPIHIDNQLIEEIDKNVLNIKIIKNNIFVKFKLIRKKNFISIFEVWIQKLF